MHKLAQLTSQAAMFDKEINDYFEIYEWVNKNFVYRDKVSEYLSANYLDLKRYSVY